MHFRSKGDVFHKPGYGEGAGIADVLKKGLNVGLKWLKPLINQHLKKGLHSLADYGSDLSDKLVDYGISKTGGGKYIVSKGGSTRLAGRGRSRSKSRSKSPKRRRKSGSGMRSRSRSRSRSKSRSRSRSKSGSGKRRTRKSKSHSRSRSRSKSNSPIFGTGRKTIKKKKSTKVRF